MKKIKLIFISIISLIGFSSFSLPEINTNKGIVYQSGYINGPFEIDDENGYINFAYKYLTFSFNNSDVYEKMSVYRDYVNVANLCFTHETSSHLLEYNKLYVNTHHFYPSIAFKNASCIYLVFEVINSESGAVIKSSKFMVIPRTDITFTQGFIGTEEIIFTYKTVDLSNSDTSFGEKYSFINYPGMFSSGTYHMLPLSELVFTYEYTAKLTYSEAILKFEDPLDLFPYLKTTEYKYKYIPLTVIQNGNEITVQPINLFVHPETLEIANVRYSGFVQTNHFFFPAGTYKMFESMEFILSIKDMGINKANIEIPTDFYPTNTLIGDCTYSEYCIVGGVSNG